MRVALADYVSEPHWHRLYPGPNCLAAQGEDGRGWAADWESWIRAAEPMRGPVPDLTDSASLGCLLALVVERCPDSAITFRHDGLVSVTYRSGDRYVGTGWRPKAEALVMALKAAP